MFNTALVTAIKRNGTRTSLAINNVTGGCYTYMVVVLPPEDVALSPELRLWPVVHGNSRLMCQEENNTSAGAVPMYSPKQFHQI